MLLPLSLLCKVVAKAAGCTVSCLATPLPLLTEAGSYPELLPLPPLDVLLFVWPKLRLILTGAFLNDQKRVTKLISP